MDVQLTRMFMELGGVVYQVKSKAGPRGTAPRQGDSFTHPLVTQRRGLGRVFPSKVAELPAQPSQECLPRECLSRPPTTVFVEVGNRRVEGFFFVGGGRGKSSRSAQKPKLRKRKVQDNPYHSGPIT